MATIDGWSVASWDKWNNIPKDRTPVLLGVLSVFFAITWITVALRFYTRIIISRTLGADDWIMFVAQLIFTIFFGFSLAATSYGAGKTMTELTLSDGKNAIRLWFICELIYIICAAVFRVSVAIFILRVTVKQSHRFILIAVSVLTSAFNVALFFYILFQCRPVSFFWLRFFDSSSGGHCAPVQSTIDALYAESGVAAFADLVFALMPFFMLWDAPHLEWKTKATVASLLGMGSVSGIAVLIRIPYIKELSDGADFAFCAIDLGVWTVVELGIGISAGSLATLRPLVRKCRNKWSTVSYSEKFTAWRQSRSPRSSRTHGDETPQPWKFVISGLDRESNDTFVEGTAGKDGLRMNPNTEELARDLITPQPSLNSMWYKSKGLILFIVFQLYRRKWSIVAIVAAIIFAGKNDNGKMKGVLYSDI